MGEQQIKFTLTELHSLFTTVNERNWATIVAGFMAYPVLDCGRLGIIKNAISGMGRMNDVYISKQNGHLVDNEQITNETLLNLTEQLYEQVQESQRQLRC